MLQIDRLDDEVIGIDLIATDGKLGKVRHKDQRDGSIDLPHLLGGIQTIDARHVDIHEDDVIRSLLEILKEQKGIVESEEGEDDVVLLGIFLQQGNVVLLLSLVIFDDSDFQNHCCVTPYGPIGSISYQKTA